MIRETNHSSSETDPNSPSEETKNGQNEPNKFFRPRSNAIVELDVEPNRELFEPQPLSMNRNITNNKNNESITR